LKITEYADRLLDDLKLIDWPENLKEMQRNWIGKSSGAVINFDVENSNLDFDVFTTRPDTIYGSTYCVLAPEHPLVLDITVDDEKDSVKKYLESTKQKSDLERQTNKEKTGVFTGAYAINPINEKRVPIWIADYVLPNYGTGSVMAVPAHDDRDYEFALKYGLDIIEVIQGESEGAFTGDGIHFNSGIIDGLNNNDATNKIVSYLQKIKKGYKHDTYRLRDWVFSRQRYWGEPFPVVFDEKNNIYVLKDSELPLELPRMKNIKPSGTGESPLANAHTWLNVEYEGIKVRRDTNTMPQLAGSSWYYIGYILKEHLGMIPLDSNAAKEELKKWLPVDLYVGGTEHAVGHLLYARFWHKFLYDLGIVDTKEPFLRLVNQGMILGSDNVKMSKSRGNVINPDDIINEYGADTLRVYEMFMGPVEAEKSWSEEGVAGIKRFIDRVYRMYNFEIVDEVESLVVSINQTVKKVTEDIEKMAYNTAISALMVFVNDVYKEKQLSKKQARVFLKLLYPFAPHITEEINKEVLKNNEVLVYADWPKYDEKLLVKDEVEMVIQVNGKVRSKVAVRVDLTEEEIKTIAFAEENVLKHLEGLVIRKVIVIPNKLVNIVAN
ncbi:MAG: class I tRNA ligase family protein, partial [Acholeplasma sp.]|nr:class I tRNA ligase family protein [Acholeplasma sp.]